MRICVCEREIEREKMGMQSILGGVGDGYSREVTAQRHSDPSSRSNGNDPTTANIWLSIQGFARITAFHLNSKSAFSPFGKI